MLRQQTLFLTICLLLVTYLPASGQYEKEAGKLLFKKVMSPAPAGPGKVSFLRSDTKNPEAPVELYVGDMTTLAEIRVLPGVNFAELRESVFGWSPDGSEFVIPQKLNGSWEMFRYKSGSRTGEQLISLAKYRISMPQEMLEQQGLTDDILLTIGQIVYSPSGKRILFLMNRPAKMALWWLDLQTANCRQATEDLTGLYGCFAPDDEHISYTINRANPGETTLSSDIVLRSLKTGKIDTLTTSPAMEYDGAISPDGKYLAFVKTTANVNNLWVMDLTSRQSRQFTFATKEKSCTLPNWTPDGRQIIFLGTGFAPQPSVFVKDFAPF